MSEIRDMQLRNIADLAQIRMVYTIKVRHNTINQDMRSKNKIQHMLRSNYKLNSCCPEANFPCPFEFQNYVRCIHDKGN